MTHSFANLIGIKTPLEVKFPAVAAFNRFKTQSSTGSKIYYHFKWGRLTMETEGGEGKIRALSRFGCQQGQSKEKYTALAMQNTQLQKSLPSLICTWQSSEIIPGSIYSFTALPEIYSLRGWLFISGVEWISKEWFSATSWFCYLRFYRRTHKAFFIQSNRKSRQSPVCSCFIALRSPSQHNRSLLWVQCTIWWHAHTGSAKFSHWLEVLEHI